MKTKQAVRAACSAYLHDAQEFLEGVKGLPSVDAAYFCRTRSFGPPKPNPCHSINSMIQHFIKNYKLLLTCLMSKLIYEFEK